MMTTTASSQHDEYRQAFLRHLPKRLESIEQRVQRYRRDGWSADGLTALNDDIQRLAGASGRYDLVEASQHLLTLEQMLGEHQSHRTLPTPQQADRMLALTAAVTASLSARPVEPAKIANSEVPPAAWWRRWTGDAPAVHAATPAVAANDASKLGGIARRIYLLSDGNAFASELAQHLEKDGFEVEPVETVAELTELLMALSPHLVLVDASRMPDVLAVGGARREAQQRGSGQRIQLLALAAADNLQSRLDARRAGADALLFPPQNIPDVLRQVHTLLAPVAEEKLRVLIVEDDRAQGLFAQSVLTNAGMQAVVEQEALHVLEALEALHPDLVLMDLHMPHANGVELTALIREHPSFKTTPIVFLSGENDPDTRFDAINAGGDDFLSKPIRPKHLITAVQNRVRRVRTLQQQQQAEGLPARDEATGLHRRAFVLDRVNEALGNGSESHDAKGGTLFVEIDNSSTLRERLGLGALEHLVVATGRVVHDELLELHVAARINDTAFLVLALDLDDAGLDALAKRIRDAIATHAFEALGKPMRLRASIGICPLRFGFGDASALLNTAERACRDAHASESGIHRYEAPKATAVDAESALVAQLREAIENDGFGLIYQPIVAVQADPEARYQTLLRMRDATGKLVPAAVILPLAERAGLMIDIDRWVLTRALSVLAQHHAEGRATRLFVPQALTTFAAREQPGWLKGELAANEASGGNLVLECRLEDALLNPPALATFAKAMRAEGIRLCLGQYEHSPQASRLLEQAPFAFVKLAPKYAASQIGQELRDELRAFVELAHGMSIRVIGHRVEDPQAAATLWMSGIDFIQGNLVQSAGGKLDFDFNATIL
ncbi:MAG: EAL domain-containing protein [Proteobacteria bacterium]|nr:EAL domain-containing protein [Pseudomonadota bacterium]